MKRKLLMLLVSAANVFALSNTLYAQAPNLGKTATFTLFSSNGPVSNTGISQITGNVGTNAGSSTAFGNVNGTMHDGDTASIKAATDLLNAYNNLAATTANNFVAPLLGNGDTLIAGVYEIGEAASLNGNLTLDGNESAVFIIRIKGALSSGAGARVILINGAQACNVFWQIEGIANFAAGTIMRGTIIANNAAIGFGTSCTLEGRALSTDGAITVDGIFAYTPIGCGSPVLNGPVAPPLGKANCYAIFSNDGEVTNTGISNITGDVGSNKGPTEGFDSLLVNGKIHRIPDTSTAKCSADLFSASTYLDTLKDDIELLYPVQFGRSLVLTPHTYIMKSAAALTDTVFLNAQGVENAVFIIKINGALTTSTFAKVILRNGAKAENVYWQIKGAVDIATNSTFVGTIICNNGALSTLKPGVVINGRLLTTSGALTTMATDAFASMIPANCKEFTSINDTKANETANIYPNPFSDAVNINIAKASSNNAYALVVYNMLGKEVIRLNVNTPQASIATSELAKGIYFYTVESNMKKVVQTGKLIAQ